jgi:hypothetical protein
MDSNPIEPFTAKAIDAEISIEMLKGWIKLCRDTHGPHCADSVFQGPSELVSTHMIDVEHNCLALANTGLSYVALSYV